MGTISSGVGLISGINSGQIIDQLISLDSRPKTLLQQRIASNNQIKLAYTDLQARLSSLLNTANALVRPSTFQSATATSSDPNSLGVTAQPTAAGGQFQFTVARTVTSQSAISTGFADGATSLVGAGTIRIGLGGGEVTTAPTLAELNGGNGVRRGTFRITDKTGSSSSVDISSAVSLEDVVKKINTAANLQVKASIGDNGLVLEDTSGGAGVLKVAEVGGGSSAKDLGILSSTAGTTLTGADINTIGRGTTLSTLNDGLGVRLKPGNIDLAITTADSATTSLTLAGKKTVGDVIDALNTAGSGKFTASLRADGKGLKIVDNTTGGATFAVTSQNGSKAAEDLGISVGDGTSTITGKTIKGALGSVLLASLDGGNGIGTDPIDLTDRQGNTATVSLTGASSLSEVISRINAAGLSIQASVNKSGTGLQLTDTSSGTGDLIVASGGGGNTAQKLGIAGTFGIGTPVVDSGSLKRKFISESTQLSTLAGGKGIAPGKFEITDSDGKSAVVDTSGFTNGTLQDVISAINAKGIGVTASVNDEGNGLLLTNTVVGSASLKVRDITGTSAADLNIAGTATGSGPGTKIDGAYVKSITVTAGDSLQSVLTKINQAGAGVTASLINDGSGATPYRLSVNANNTGLNGRFTFDQGTTGLGLDTLVKAQNASVFLGSATGTNPVLISSSSNTVNNVIPGVSLSLLAASDKPVSVTIAQTADNAVSQLKTFTTTFNSLTSKIGDLTKFDTTTNAKGLLLGDQTATSITDEVFRGINATIVGAGKYTRLSQIGVTVGANNQVSFDEDKFRAAYASDPTAVQRLFTAFNATATTSTTDKVTKKVTETVVKTPFGTTPAGVKTGVDSDGNAFSTTTKIEGFGLAYTIQNSINKLIDPVNGTIIRQNKSLDTANDLFNDRIDTLSALLDAKKARLQKQFANMETVLSQLQSQQSSIGKISSISSSSK